MAENYNFTNLSIPLARKAQNFAPRKPLEDLLRDKKPSKNPTKFEVAFRKWYGEKMAHEQQAWNNLYATAQLVSFYRQGEFLLQRYRYGGGYYVRPNTQSDTYQKLAMNLMTFHSQVCEAKIIASNPNVNIRAADDTPQSISSAQAMRPIIDCYETEFYTVKYSRREAVDFLTNGMIIPRVRWNPFKGGQSVQSREVNQVQRQTDAGYGDCAECGHSGDAVDNEGTPIFGEQCPECGSKMVDVKPPTMINMSQISMGQSMPVGEPELVRTAFQGWRWDLSKDLEDSTWAIYRQRITQGAVNLMIGGDVIIPDSQSSDDYGLQILHALSYAGQAYAGTSSQQYGGGNRSSDNQPTMAECWLSPEDQAMLDIDETETISGQVIPKGKLSDFGQGQHVCVVALNDAAAIVGVYKNECHSNEVTTGQWIMQSESGAGRGMEDTAAVAQRFNAADGQIYQGLAAGATPGIMIDTSILKEDQGHYVGRPGVNIDVNLALLPPGLGMKDAVHVPNLGNVNPQYISYSSQFLRQMAQITSFATEFSDGLIGVDNRTATGAQITAALANSLYAPMLGTKGQTRVRIAQMIVALVQKHSVAGRYYAGKGNARGRLVSGQDLRGQVVFELVPNSELPVTPFSQQTDIRVMVESLGGPEGFIMFKKQEPETFKQLTAPFNYKPEIDMVDQVSTLCLQRVEQMKEGLQSGIDDPVMLVDNLRPPISKYEPHKAEKKIWCAAWLDLQQGQEAPQVIREAVEQMWVRLENLGTQQSMPESANAGLIAGIQVAASQAPSALGSAALQNAQGNDVASQEQELAHDHEQQSQDRELDAATELASQHHESEMKDKEIAGQIAVTREQGKNAVETAKIAAKNKPKPKAA